MEFPILRLKMISVKNGQAHIEKMCWGCGDDHQLKVPVDDLNSETTSATMCIDCAVKIEQDL